MPTRTGKRGSTKKPSKTRHKATKVTSGEYAGETVPGLPGKPRPGSSLRWRMNHKPRKRGGK